MRHTRSEAVSYTHLDVYKRQVPRGTDDRLNIVILRFPTENRLCLIRGRDELRRVARTPCRHFALDGLPDDLLRRVDDLLNREADAVSEVEDVVLAAVHQIFRGENVRGREVGDVDIVADTGAVSCRIVVAKDRDVVTLPCLLYTSRCV